MQAFADEPVPFHSLTDFVMTADNVLRCTEEKVIYQFKPGYVRYEPEDGDTRTVEKSGPESVNWRNKWNNAVDVTVREDCVCARGYTCELPLPADRDGDMYECFWFLSTVLIEAYPQSSPDK